MWRCLIACPPCFAGMVDAGITAYVQLNGVHLHADAEHAMDADDLRVFEAVARLGSMNRAAAELNTVQSNVTGRIRALEAELGVPLFHRHARGVSPTAAAQRLLPYAGRVRRLLADARAAVQDDGTPAGPIVVGSLETTA